MLPRKRNNLKVLTLPVGQLQTNCYLVFDEGSKDAIIIDPGDDADYIQRIISDNALSPKLVLATHGHFDHILGVTELRLAYRIPFLLNKKDIFLVRSVKDRAFYHLRLKVPQIALPDSFLQEGDILKIGGNKLEILETPGHTPGSISLWDKKSKLVFVGDLIFENKQTGRTDFSYSDPILLKKSVKKILRLPMATQVFSGHGESFRT